jgi:peptidoglycan/xylan/chitin deacetylase (PgdA/CDA1 family)
MRRLVWTPSSNRSAGLTPISPSRKILCISALAIVALTSVGAPSVASSRPIRVGAKLSQSGRRLIFSLHTSRPVPLSQLEQLPDPGNTRYVCLVLQRVGRSGGRRLCVGGTNDAHRRIGLELFNAAGKITGKQTLAARVKRPSSNKLVMALLPSAAGLSPHRYRWQVLTNLDDCGTMQPAACEVNWPVGGTRSFRLRPVRAIGCTGGVEGLVTHGPRDRRVVALTFDDGPSDYTPEFLDVLREKGAPGTFFEIGQEIAGRESTMRRILSEGDEIGNHTMHHTEFPGYSSIAPVSDLIESATHFKPCLFRPPGGAADSAVIGAAAADDLQTITWDVDPTDWSNPGSNTVYSRVVEAVQPGSIILMHDGGGDRSGTLAALPGIIATLRARGYGFATLTNLLGERMIYQPYG